MEILIIFTLTLLNGFFALSEIALISVKRSRIEYLSEQGNSRAKIILALLDKPENFLSSVQVIFRGGQFFEGADALGSV